MAAESREGNRSRAVKPPGVASVAAEQSLLPPKPVNRSLGAPRGDRQLPYGFSTTRKNLRTAAESGVPVFEPSSIQEVVA